jgi:hypothetical protein
VDLRRERTVNHCLLRDVVASIPERPDDRHGGDPFKAGDRQADETREEFAHSLVIQFWEECFGVEFLSRPELDQVRKLLLQARRGLVFSGETAQAVPQTMGGMRETDGLDRLINLLTIFKLLVDAREVLVLSSPGFSPQLDELASERINRVYQHVFDNFTATLDRQAIAHAAGMSLLASRMSNKVRVRVGMIRTKCRKCSSKHTLNTEIH